MVFGFFRLIVFICGGMIMKVVLQVIVGLILLIVAAICPFPIMIAIPGVVWRIVIGMLGCFLCISGIYKKVRK